MIRRGPLLRKAICRHFRGRTAQPRHQRAIPPVGKLWSRLDYLPNAIRDGAFEVSDLILLAYRSQSAAFVAGEALAVLQQEAGTEPEDIVVVTRDATGRVSVNQSTDLATGRPLGGGRWGTMIGMLFLDQRKPVRGGKGLAAQLMDAGLDSAFLQATSKALAVGSAVVGLRVRLLGADAVLDRVRSLKGEPTILQTRLDAATEEALYDMQAQIPDQVLRQHPADDLI